MSPAVVNSAASDPGLSSFDEDESWVPLESPSTTSPDNDQPIEEVNTPGIASANIISATAMVPSPRPNSNSAPTTTARRTSGDNSIQTLQRRVEMRRHLQQRLVHHPIHLLWSHFLWHLAQEFWNLDVQIRVAVLFLAVGGVAKIFCMMTWYLWYPRTILLVCVMAGSWIYLNANDIPQRIERLVQAIIDLPHRIPEFLEGLDPRQARILCVVLFFVPTLLQMRTISFLAGLNASGGGFIWNFWIAVLMGAGSAYFLTSPRTKAARDVSQLCLLVLYASALWITLRQWDIITMPSLAAPFFLSTGTLLLAYDDQDSMEWFSRTVRYALRLTLRDILANVGESVQEDEMLQLAMLRWIVDYWSYTPPQQQQTQQNATANPTSSSTSSTDTPNTTQGGQELQWDELLPMLNIATDQMASEVHSLQHPQPNPGTSASHSSSADSTAPPPPPTATGSGNSNNNSSTNTSDDPLQNLHAMLASMSVDDRAKPAVAAYKRHVEEFPPSRDLALWVSIIRRCPACLTLMWHVLVASMFQPFAVSFRILLLLLPLIGLEVIRIRAWAVACEALSRLVEAGRDDHPAEDTATDQTSNTNPDFALPFSELLSKVDSMTILLSGDDDTIISKVRTDTNDGVTSITAQMTIPSLLIVWRNVKSSVKALEVSLTAARCVQTGAVALEFAKNVMSLAQFGSEVSRHGWMHGLTVIAKEVILNHQGDIRRSPEGPNATFTQAAVSAVHNGHVVARNLQVLASEDENVGHIVSPIVGLFGFVGGFFQGKEKEQDRQNGQDGSATEESTPLNTDKGEKKDERDTSVDESVSSVQDESKTDVARKQNFEDKKSPSRDANAQDDRWDDIKQKEHEVLKASEVTNVELAAKPENESCDSRGAASDKQAELKPACDNKESQVQENMGATATCDRQQSSEIGAPAKKAALVRVDDEDSKSKGTELKCAPAAEPRGVTGAPEDLALIMELIADAFELHLIDETEKNEFCLKLSTGAKDEALLAGMKKTLQGLILETSHDTEQPTMPTARSSENDDNNNNRKEASKTQGSDSKSDSAWSPIIDSVASEEQAAIQPLDYSERLADAVRTREELSMPQLSETEGLAVTDGDGIPTVASSAPDRQRDEEDNMWVKVGGGIAVLGAVVGGAFLAMNQDNPNNANNNNPGGENQRNRSSVTVERLDDNEDQNEWESTGRDASRQPQ